MGLPSRGVVAFVGAGGKTGAIRRLLHERPASLATTTTHLGRDGFGRGLLVVFPEAAALERAAAQLDSGRPLTLALAAGSRLQGPPLVWLEAWSRQRPGDLLLVEADGAARRLVKLPAAHEPAWPPGPLARVVLVVGLAALGRAPAEVAHRPQRFGAGGTVAVADVERMLDAYLLRLPPRAALSVLLTGAGGLRPEVLHRLVSHLERRVRRRDPRLQDPGVPLRVAAAHDLASGPFQSWDLGRGTKRRAVTLPGVCGILLAAGLGRRYGRTAAGESKLLELWRGKPLVEHAARHLLAAGFGLVIVVTGPRDAGVRAAVRRAAAAGVVPVRFVRNMLPARGLGSSVRAAARAVPPGFGMLFAHADMPAVRVSTLRRIATLGSTLQHGIVRPVVRGAPRNPAYFPAALLPALRRLPDADGGRAVVAAHPERVFPLRLDPGTDLVDVDRPADLARLQSARSRGMPSRREESRPLVLCIGCGDLGTGAAHALVRAGFPVVIVEKARPLAVRRRVAFSEAARSGEVVVEGIVCQRTKLDALRRGGAWRRDRRGHAIPLVVVPVSRALAALRPSIVVDARMTKKQALDLPASSFRVALGPGHRAGIDCDVVVETLRGPRLGRVLWRGGAAPDTGVPGEVGGATRERLLRSPSAGRLRVLAGIGTPVQRGQVVARVGTRAIRARIGGIVRGMLRDGEGVRAGQKLGDIDPRPRQPPVDRISDKARAIGQGVLEAVRAHRTLAVPSPPGRRNRRARSGHRPRGRSPRLRAARS